MNNKILIGSGIIILVVAAFFIFDNSDNEIKNPLKEQAVNIGNNIKQNNNFINGKNVNKEVSIKTKENKKVTKNDTIEVENNENFNKGNSNLAGNYNPENNEYIFNEKEFENFAYKNNLEEIEDLDNDVKIFAKHVPVKSDFAPPMPPVLIKVKFKEKTKLVPLRSDLVNANKNIYVVNKNSNKEIEVKKIETKKLYSFTPPAIGQN